MGDWAILECIEEKIHPTTVFIFVWNTIYILFFSFLQYFNWSIRVSMLAMDKEYCNIQNHLIYKNPVDNLDEYHMGKLIVYSIKLFEKILVYLK